MGYNEFYISFNHIFLTFILFYSRDTLKWQSRFVYGEGLYLQKGIRLFASVLSAAISGMEVCPVQVEADVSSGLPCFTMVGFPSTQVKEAQDRVRTALKNNGISLPPKKVTVNLAPADLRKEGAGFDLPVAAAVLAASGFIEPQLLRNVMVVGELSLNGEVRSVSGVLPRVIRARELGCRYCIIPFENLAEGALVKDMKVGRSPKYKRSFEACLRSGCIWKRKSVFRGKFRRESGRRESGGFRGNLWSGECQKSC